VNVNLELTDHCNLRCGMCSQSLRDEAHGAPPTFMDFSTWRAAIRGLRGLPEVSLCPHWLGEPTLHPRFDALVEYAFAVNRDNTLFRWFKLHTNAVILPESRARMLLRLPRWPDAAPDTFRTVHFSVDAFGRDAYARVKGADKREIVYRNVERFLALRLASGLRRPAVHVAFVVQDGNVDEVEAFVQHWRDQLARGGSRPTVTAEWPPMDLDAVYLRRWNTGDQARADALHAAACAAVGLPATLRPMGAF
jgi:molybdenum cofactor biosynthesis enzyme MoaA